MAQSVSKVSEFVWDVTIKSGYMFSDGTPVNAQHVADSLTEQNTKNENAQSSLGTMTVTVLGRSSLRIQSERATHVMDSVLAEWAFVIYTRDPEGNFLFTGPFAIKAFLEDQIKLVPNEFYHLARERPVVKIMQFDDGHDLAESVKAKNVDIGFHLPIDTLPEL